MKMISFPGKSKIELDDFKRKPPKIVNRAAKAKEKVAIIGNLFSRKGEVE